MPFFLLLSYLLGSIPTAVWLGRWLHGVDVREHGSGNAGATNTIRVLGLRTGLFVFVLDVSKGYGAVSLSYFLHGIGWGLEEFVGVRIALGVSAFLGHLWPVFAGFRGGKGVATLLGVVLSLTPLAALCALGVFSLVLALFRYVSLGSMLAGLSYPLLCHFVYSDRSVVLLVFSVVMALLLLYTHRSNISRLAHGTENRFSVRGGGARGGVGRERSSGDLG